MARETSSDSPIVIKKYANRRLYNTDSSTYVTLEDVALMVKEGKDFVVYHAKSGEDITHQVLSQIIFDQESKGETLLPINFMRQLIGFYGDNIQKLVPSYLEFSLETLSKEQERFSRQLAQWGASPFDVMQKQIQENLSNFERAVSFFSPFNPEGAADKSAASGESTTTTDADTDIARLKAQLNDIQKQLNELSKKKN